MAENSALLCLEDTKEKNIYKYDISIRNVRQNLVYGIDTLLNSEVMN